MEINKCISNYETNRVKEINIVYITDKNYFPNTCISIYSIKKNRNPQLNYQIYVVLDQVPEKEAETLYRLESEGFQLYLIRVKFDLSMFGRLDFPVSMTACIKFRLAELLPTLEKVLYLDGDIIVQNDLLELFITNIEDVYAAVVRDLIAENMIPSAMDKLKSGLRYYFNSGMMLLNLRKIREDGIQDKLVDYRLNGINYFMDQDALNVVFGDNVRYLPCKYNYLITLNDFATNHSITEEYGYDTNCSEFARLGLSEIIHLTGPKKAWIEYIPYVTEIFMRYYTSSPFADIYYFEPCLPDTEPLKLKQKYIFPFGELPRGSRIALWGAGKVGQEFYSQVCATGFCEVICVVDENAEQYNQDNNTWKGVYTVTLPDKLKDVEMDYIIVAVKNEQIAKNIKHKAESYGLDLEHIIWKYPVY